MKGALCHNRRAHGVEDRGRSLRERGESLLEVLATVFLMGVGFVMLLDGIFAVVMVSDRNQGFTRASIAVQAYAESLMQPATEMPSPTIVGQVPQVDFTTYIPCATAEAFPSPPGGVIPVDPSNQPLFTATVSDVKYWNGAYDAGGSPVFDSDVGACYTYMFSHQVTTTDSAGNTVYYQKDRGMQQITVKIDSGPRSHGGPGGERIVDTLTFIKRDQRCPGTFDNADLGPC